MSKNQRGQSTIEFLLTFMFALAFLFLFVNISVNYSAGYLVHYATFMASRTYMTADTATPNGGEETARQEALTTLKRFRVAAVGVPVDSVKNCCSNTVDGFYINSAYTSSLNAPLFVGAVTVFKKPLSYFRAIAGDTEIRHISESFLGKDPVRNECWQRTCQAINMSMTNNPGSCTSGNDVNDVTVFDNGC